MTDRELMQQALDALEEAVFYLGSEYTCVEKEGDAAITALRERLEQPEQEPRQWQGLTDEDVKSIWRDIDGSEGLLMRFARVIEAKLKEKNT